MANKNYFTFLDIPDGSGSTVRWHAKDAEAQANIAQVASGKADKSTTYTKTEVDTMFDEFAGPVYDETDHGFDFPSTAKMSYDSVNHGFVFG